MALVLPIASESTLLGSGVVIEISNGHFFIATALHLFGECRQIRVGIPPHNGDCSAVQTYPLNQARAYEAKLVASNPLADVGIIAFKEAGTAPISRLAGPTEIPAVGRSIVALGYPFAPIGSLLETWAPGTVIARTRRMITPKSGIDEFVISNQSHPGSSGSAVLGREDGILYGILRGSLAPPEMLRVGNIPIATDTSVTFVTAAHYVTELLPFARAAVAQT